MPKVAALTLVGVLASGFLSSVPLRRLEHQSSSDTFAAKENVQSSEGAVREIEGLIQQLGDRKFAVREQARKRLAEFGITALPQLRDALATTSDLEVRRHCGALLEAIEEQEVTSRTIKAGDVEFCVVTSPVWLVPKIGEETKVVLGIRFTNRGRDRVLFCLQDTVLINLTNAAGEEVRRDGGRDRGDMNAIGYSPAIGPGESYTFRFVGAKLCWGKDNNDLRLVYVDRGTCEYRCFEGLSLGKFHVNINYRNKWTNSPDSSSRLWVGDVCTQQVTVEVK